MEDISANPGGLLGRLGNESFLTHLLARSNPAMLASAHVGELRGLRTTRKTKKFSMTEEVRNPFLDSSDSVLYPSHYP